jgi:adenine-specific DNA-methyltransferase
MQKLKMHSPDLTQENIAHIRERFPNCVTEAHDANGKVTYRVDFDLLRQELAGELVEGPQERYRLDWPGKRQAMLTANAPIAKSLRPCRGESVNFDTTENLYIEGDNLEALKLLQESYLSKVKMIYIDPPYNTGNDFIYKDDFAENSEDFLRRDGQIDDDGNRMEPNLESNGRFHSDWLSMIYQRVCIARNLLTDDGVIFISIGDSEVENLKKICNEIFGEGNFIGNLVWQSRTSISNDHEISANHNHTIIFAKNRTFLSFGGDPLESNDYINNDNDPRGPWKLVPIDANHAGGATYYPIVNPKTGKTYYPPNGRIWAYNEVGYTKLLSEGRIKFGLNDDSAPKRKLYFNERIDKGDRKTPSSILLDAGTTKDGTSEIMVLFDNRKIFDYPKPTRFLNKLLLYGSKNDMTIRLAHHKLLAA